MAGVEDIAQTRELAPEQRDLFRAVPAEPIRVAAVADVHFADDARGTLRPHLEELPACADALLIGGDLTRLGWAEEARALAQELAGSAVPVVAVLGNHDYHSGEEAAITELMEEAGVTVLEGTSTVIDIDGTRLGIVGSKGFGGGFPGAGLAEFGEPEMKAFIRHARGIADRLHSVLSDLDADHRIVLIHYAPIEGTLEGEPPGLFPFLGSDLLGEAIDAAGADLVIHGHAHAGTEKGITRTGIPVRNVALPVIRRPFKIYPIGSRDDGGH